MQGAQGLTPSNEQTYESIIGQYKPVGAMYPGGEHELSGINNINTDAGEKTMPGATLTDWASPFGNVPGEEIQEQVTEETAPIRTDFGRIDPLTTNQKPGFFQGIGQKLGMTQVSDADRAANEAYMGGTNTWSQGTGPLDQGTGLQIGRDPTTGRMIGGDFAGKNAPGTSGWGSANFGEMAQKWDEEYGDMVYKTDKMKQKKARMENLAAEQVVQQQVAQQERIRNERAAASAANQMTQRRPGMGGSHMSRSVQQGGLGLTTGQAQAVSDANAAAGMGGWNLAHGGRVGYNEGGRVGILAAF